MKATCYKRPWCSCWPRCSLCPGQAPETGAVLGYLFAGVIIGPSVLGLVGNPQSVAQFSELGVVLLLFIIGLELSPKRLWVMRKAVFGVGLAQVLLTAMVMGAVALWAFGQSWNSAIVLGLGLALSSTAFGLQSLAERKELNSPTGAWPLRSCCSRTSRRSR